jgi:hypothetical protein
MIQLNNFLPILPTITPKPRLAIRNRRVRIPLHALLLLVPLPIKLNPPIPMIAAMRRQFLDLPIGPGVYFLKPLVAFSDHDADLCVFWEAEVCDLPV